jgi:hypothetical protein
MTPARRARLKARAMIVMIVGCVLPLGFFMIPKLRALPMWVYLAVFAVAFLLACSAAVLYVVASVPADPIACPFCGYSRRGNVTGKCPECGRSVKSDPLAPYVGPRQGSRRD